MPQIIDNVENLEVKPDGRIIFRRHAFRLSKKCNRVTIDLDKLFARHQMARLKNSKCVTVHAQQTYFVGEKINEQLWPNEIGGKNP